jgi:hypothetical protein
MLPFPKWKQSNVINQPPDGWLITLGNDPMLGLSVGSAAGRLSSQWWSWLAMASFHHGHFIHEPIGQ